MEPSPVRGQALVEGRMVKPLALSSWTHRRKHCLHHNYLVGKATDTARTGRDTYQLAWKEHCLSGRGH